MLQISLYDALFPSTTEGSEGEDCRLEDRPLVLSDISQITQYYDISDDTNEHAHADCEVANVDYGLHSVGAARLCSTLSASGGTLVPSARKSVWPRRHDRKRSRVTSVKKVICGDAELCRDLERHAPSQTCQVEYAVQSDQAAMIRCPILSFNFESETAQAVTCCRQCAVVMTLFY